MSRDYNVKKINEGREPEKRYTIDEAVEILGICKRSIYQARKDGLLPSSQKCKKGHVYFLWSDFEAYWKNIRRA